MVYELVSGLINQGLVINHGGILSGITMVYELVFPQKRHDNE